MRAAVLHEHGSPPVCGEFDDPRPAEGHVVVEVEAAGVNHLDLQKASGRFYTGSPGIRDPPRAEHTHTRARSMRSRWPPPI